ncbi:MAG: hypothetical protein ACTHOP_15080, partial [Mesorhizobium sp.]
RAALRYQSGANPACAAPQLANEPEPEPIYTKYNASLIIDKGNARLDRAFSRLRMAWIGSPRCRPACRGEWRLSGLADAVTPRPRRLPIWAGVAGRSAAA